MANSLSDQLLKAGLITQDQIEKADQDKQQQKQKARAKFNKKPASQQARGPSNKPETRGPATKTNAKKQSKQPSELAQFYNQRNQLEQAERAEEEKRKRAAAERRRKTRKQVRELITAHLKNDESAEVRYNFVVGDNVKYLFVTPAQQQQIADGQLSITFLDGKRCLIPVEIGQQILALDPDKVVIRYTADAADTEVLAEPAALAIDSTAATTSNNAEKTLTEKP